MTKFGAIVLCGGVSSRMGRSKGWLPFGDEVLLQRITRIVAGACSPVVVVAAKSQALPALPHNVVIVNDERLNCGPLAGLESGMKAIECEDFFVTSCDVPLLTHELILKVRRALIEPFDIAVSKVEEKQHPLLGSYRRRLLPIITAALDAGERRMISFLERQRTKFVESISIDDVRNVNTPAEFAEVLAFAIRTGLISASQSRTVLDS